MADDYWLKQKDEPLFPDIIWSRPENKRQAGKLLIIGGQAQSLGAPAAAYTAANQAGVGTARVLLPESTRKLIGKVFPEAEFGPSAPSGSFSRAAVDSMLELASWADGVLLAGDFGKNAETSVGLEIFVDKYKGPLTITGDAIDKFIESDSPLARRDQTAAVMDLGRLQKLSVIDVESHLVLHRMSLHELAEVLHEWTHRDPGAFITYHQGHLVVSVDGEISTTPAEGTDLSTLAAYISVWWLQQPDKPFEAITSAVYKTE